MDTLGTIVEAMNAAADDLGVSPSFRADVGGDEVSRPKPFPDLPLLGARALRVSAQDCVVVGDSPVDIRAGRSAGMKTVAVLYGYGDSAAVAEAGPDAVIRRFSELPSVVAALERG